MLSTVYHLIINDCVLVALSQLLSSWDMQPFLAVGQNDPPQLRAGWDAEH